MVLINLGYDPRKTYRWKVLPSEYSKEYYNKKLVIRVHQKLWEKVKNIMKYQKKGWDTLILIDGARRSGKSTIGKTIAYLINPYLTINNFVAGIEEAPEKIAKAKQKDVLFFDEGSLIANSKDAMRRKNVQLEKIIDVVGVKKLVLIFCMPSFFSISRSLAIQHSRFLIHIYTGKKLERGKFMYFGTKRKKKLYTIGKKKFESYRKPKSNWTGKFVDFKLPFEDAYEKLKAESLREALGLSKKGEKKVLTRSDYLTEFLIKFKENNPEVSDKIISKGFGISTREYYRRKARYKAMSAE